MALLDRDRADGRLESVRRARENKIIPRAPRQIADRIQCASSGQTQVSRQIVRGRADELRRCLAGIGFVR